MTFPEIYSANGLIELIQEIGFLPLLDSGINGFSAEEIVDEDCRYVTFPEGGWDWPLWKWKGEIVNEGLHNKLYRMPADARNKLKETIERIINEGCNGLICIIL